MKRYIYIWITILSFLGCKEIKEYDFNNKYFELEPERKAKVDAFGFYLSELIKGVAFYDNKIFINTHNRDGIELASVDRKEKVKGRWYEFNSNGENIAIFILPDSTGFVQYKGLQYNILKIRDATERKKKTLLSYNQIREYTNNGSVIGKVKKTILSKYEIKVAFEKYVKEKVAEEVCYYNTSGQLVNQMIYEISPKDEKKILNAEYLYKYERGNKIYYRYKKYNNNENARGVFRHLDFNEEGEKNSDEIIYKYNKHNQLTVVQQNDEYRKFKQEYCYSEDSLLVEIKTYDFSHELINITKIKHKKNKGTQLLKYSKEGERKRILTYDNKCFLISNIPYSNMKEAYWGWRQEVKYSFNTVSVENFNRTSGGGYDGYGEYIWEEQLSFDAYGNLLKRNSTYKQEPLKSRSDLEVYKVEYKEAFSYIYDKQGNWTKIKITDNQKEYPIIIERNIEYY